LSLKPEKEESVNELEKPDEFLDHISDSEIPKEEYESLDVKLNWFRVIIVAFAITVVIAGIIQLIFWILSRYYAPEIVYLFLSWGYLIATGLLLIFGGCIGTVRQSFTIDRIRKRFSKGEKITGADTKIAIGSAYTYIFSGFFLGILTIIIWAIQRVPS